MDYSFNGEVAALYGVDEAVFIHNLYWWIRKNEANGRHYYDGRTWTYNTMGAFTNLFPFWSLKQVRRIIAKLRDNRAIHIGNYNNRFGDRTQWYSLSEEVLNFYQKGQFTNAQMGTNKRPNAHKQTPKCAQTNAQTGTALPDSKPDINTNSKPDIYSAKQKRFNPPTFDEVKAYCKSRNNSIDPLRFYEFYTADPERQWIDSNGNPVKSWKQKILTWESRQSEKGSHNQPKSEPNYDYQGDDTL